MEAYDRVSKKKKKNNKNVETILFFSFLFLLERSSHAKQFMYGVRCFEDPLTSYHSCVWSSMPTMTNFFFFLRKKKKKVKGNRDM